MTCTHTHNFDGSLHRSRTHPLDPLFDSIDSFDPSLSSRGLPDPLCMIWIGLHFTHIACKILFEMLSTHIPTNNSRNQPPPQNKKHSRTRFVSLTHTHVGGGRARREEVHARRTYSRLFPNHTRTGTRWSSFLYEMAAHVLIGTRVAVVYLRRWCTTRARNKVRLDAFARYF